MSSLKRHKRIDTGENIVKCELCNTSYSSSSYLKMHKRMHTGDNQVKCDLCNINYPSSYIKVHKRMHTGEDIHMWFFYKKYSRIVNLN